MNCIRCGRRIPEGQMFCEACAGVVDEPLQESAYMNKHIVLPAQRAEQPELVLSGGADGQVLLYNVAERKVQRNYTGHKKAVNSVILHPTREVVVSCSDDKTVRMWVDSE